MMRALNIAAFFALAVLSVSASHHGGAADDTAADDTAAATEAVTTITATLDFDPATADAKTAAFKTGVFTAMALPTGVTEEHVTLVFVVVPVVEAPAEDSGGGHRRLTSAEYDVTVTVTFPDGVSANEIGTAVSGVTTAQIETEVTAAFEAAHLDEPTIDVSHVGDPPTREHDVSGARFGAALGAVVAAVVVGAGRA